MSRREHRSQLRFPQLKRVALERFSLYTQRSEIELAVPEGVLCLAGANGIGKSTFLAAVNFGITGIVPLVSRDFLSAPEYYKDGLRFNAAFFDGRIVEDDRDAAEIAVDFEVGDTIFSVTRGIFDTEALRALSITSRDGRSLIDPATSSAEEKHRIYAARLAEAVGVKTFHQFVFLQHFVLTFDESRHLLFWDPRALEQALYLAFGGDYETAQSAERLRREMEKAESRGRNIQFHATSVQNRIQVLEEAIDGPADDSNDDEELRATYAQLLQEQDRGEKIVDRIGSKSSDAEVALADASAALVALRKDYESTFARLTGKRSMVDVHPLVRSTIDDHRCALCGTAGDEVSAQLKAALKGRECPLCRSKLQVSADGNADLLASLKKIDASLGKAKVKLESCATTRTRLAREKEEAQSQYEKAQAALRAFETKHQKILSNARDKDASKTDGVSHAIENLKTEHKALLTKRREAYAQRDEFKKQLKTLQRSLEAAYASAEEHFVPLFRKLAELFLGIELDIRLEGKAAGINLLLELRSTIRREQHQLSESQRFFVDIALRMALAQFMSNADARAALLVDTPEGSLDIAYESRAGEMFAQFVNEGHRMMMTANINSSQLLQKLARECGKSRMTLERMTTWTDLSEVQVQENQLFQHAYAAIEKELRGAHA